MYTQLDIMTASSRLNWRKRTRMFIYFSLMTRKGVNVRVGVPMWLDNDLEICRPSRDGTNLSRLVVTRGHI